MFRRGLFEGSTRNDRCMLQYHSKDLEDSLTLEGALDLQGQRGYAVL